MFLKRRNTVRLIDRREDKRPPLVRDRRSLIISSILFAVVIIFSIRFTESQTLIEWCFQSIGLPLSSGGNGMGWHYPNLFLLLLMVVILFVMNRALNRGKFMAFIIIMILLSKAPDWIVWMLHNGFGIFSI